MRALIRAALWFTMSIVAMGAAYGAGFVSAERLVDVWEGDDAVVRPVRSAAEALGDRLGSVAHAPGADGGTAGDDGAAVGGDPDSPSDRADDAAAGDLTVFWDALRIVRAEAYGTPPADEDVTYGAVRGSLRALDDPYTLFSDPIDTAVQQPELEGEFEGIGAYVSTNEDGLLVIQTPMRGQPAERAGVRAGDVVIKVDGEDITDLDVNEAVLLIRGPKGTTVVLTILREGRSQPLEISVVRDKIDIPSVNNVKLLPALGGPDVGYLQLTVFSAETKDELRDALEELIGLGARAIVLDVRDNPGGYLNAAIDVASEFIADGVIVFQEDSRGKRMPMDAGSGGIALDLPLVVLVNRGSASASEIVAGAIQDHGRGVLVGETTFGKGSVQNVHELSDGSQLRVTVAAWRTPNGKLIHKEGIEPDVVVTPAPVPTPRPTDAAAIPAPTATETPAPTATPVDTTTTDGGAGQVDDVQLRRAVEEANRLLEAG